MSFYRHDVTKFDPSANPVWSGTVRWVRTLTGCQPRGLTWRFNFPFGPPLLATVLLIGLAHNSEILS